MRVVTINKNEYRFVNESFSNYRNWGHKTRLYKNDNFISENKSIYINRTWESYQYQSCMQQSVYNLIDEEVKELIYSYKSENNIKRLKKEIKESLIEQYKNTSELYKVLKEI